MKDLCQPSIDILRERCVSWFKSRGIRGPLHFPDHEELLFGEETPEVVNVVFFGSFLKRFLESANWTPRRFRLWVLCEATRDVLTHLFGVPARQIGLIPRYQLFPCSQAQRAFPRAGEPFTLVFAGRISPTKNIEMLLRTISFLQSEQNVPVELALFGRFDSELHVDRDPPPEGERFSDYQRRVAECIGECAWRTPPQLVEGLGAEDWLRQDLRNPVFTSFSTFLCEDFGVSVAQAHALGWPCLLSDWGAHRDVRGSGVRKLPVSQIGTHDEPKALLALKARELARGIKRVIETTPPPARLPRDGGKAPLPAIVTVGQLDAIRRALVGKLGRNAHLISRGEIYRVDGTRSGAIFFSNYRQLFSGAVPSAECVVLVNNFNERHPSLAHVARASQLLSDRAARAGVTLTYLSAEEIFHTDTLSRLLCAKKVILPFFVAGMLPMALFVRRTLSDRVPLSVFAFVPKQGGQEPLRAELRKLKTALRPDDRLCEFDRSESLDERIPEEFTFS